MAVTWEIRGSVLVITVIGFGGEEPAQAIAEALVDPKFKPGTALLFDMRQSTDSPTSDQMHERATRLAPLLAKGISHRLALVVGPHKYQYGLARMAAAHADLKGMHLEIFRELSDALQWLTATAASAPAGT